MKFIYACDIHGDEYKYEKLLTEAIKLKAEYLVFGGDLLPKNYNDRYNEQRIFIDQFFDNYFSELKENNIKCICILGNDDLEQLDEIFENECSKFDNVFNIDNKKADFEDVSFIGLSKVLDHPLGVKIEL